MSSSLLSKFFFLLRISIFCCQSIKRYVVSDIDRRRWSDIDFDLLEYIQKKLSLPDVVRCGAVCRSWRSVTKTHVTSPLKLLSPVPPLLVFYYNNYNPSRYFLDHVTEGEDFFYKLNHNTDNILKQVSVCVGFSHGWFLFLEKPKNDDQNKSLYLFHPTLLYGDPVCFPHIPLPQGSWEKPICKAALVGDPIFGSSGVVVIHGTDNNLLFAKRGGEGFTPLENQSHHREPRSVEKDIICINNCIYGFTFTDDGRHHHVEIWDCTTGQCLPRKVLDFDTTFQNDSKDWGPSKRSTLHLVESEGELLLVSLQLQKYGVLAPKYHGWFFQSSPNTCRVYKMDFKGKEWVQIDSLGDQIIFVMDYQTMSLPCGQFPQYENSVYFKCDRVGRPDRLEVFDMETRTHNEILINRFDFG